MMLSKNFRMAVASRSNYLLGTHSVLISSTDSSLRMASGAIDFSQSWEEESRFTDRRLFSSLQHRVISTDRIEYQGGGGSTSIEYHHVWRGCKYMVVLNRKKEKKNGGKERDNSSVGHGWIAEHRQERPLVIGKTRGKEPEGPEE